MKYVLLVHFMITNFHFLIFGVRLSSGQLTDAAMATRSVPNGRTVGNGRFQVQLFKLSYVRNEVVYSLYIVGTCVAYVK